MSTIAAAIAIALVPAVCARPAGADTTATAAFGEIVVTGGPERNGYRVLESAIQSDPAKTPKLPILSMMPGLAALKVHKELIEIAVESFEVGTKTASRILTPLIATIGTLAVIALSPEQGEEKLDPSAWILIIDRAPRPAPMHATPPCRKVRFSGSQPGPALTCPILRQTMSELPPTLFIDAGGGSDAINLDGLKFPLLRGREVWAGAGNDTIAGSKFGDQLAGDAGRDEILAGDGDDEIWGFHRDLGASFNDVDGALYPDDDTLDGEAGSDVIFGQYDHDLIDGGPGDDNRGPKLRPELPDDPDEAEWLLGYLEMNLTENAALQGGAGRDVVIGGTGADTMEGGPGHDTLLSRESDFQNFNEVDPHVNCNGAGVMRPSFEYYRSSPGDVVSDCTHEVTFSVPALLAGLIAWVEREDSRIVFPWQAADDPGDESTY